MKRRTLLISAGVIGGAIVGGLVWLSTQTYEIMIPQSAIQSELDKKFPIEKSAMFVINFRIENPKVILREGSDRIRLTADINISSPIQDDAKGKAEISGKVRFDKNTGQFFFSEAKIDKIDVEGSSGDIIQKFDSMASDAMGEFLENQPLYTLDTNDFRQAFFKATLKQIVIRDQNVVLRMGLGF
jgi:hypothetical protein